MDITDNETTVRIAAMREVIKKLRSDNLSEGHCFMIFDDEPPEDQAYYEYPDGSIRIEQLNNGSVDLPRIVIRHLREDEIAAVKEKHEVFR